MRTQEEEKELQDLLVDEIILELKRHSQILFHTKTAGHLIFKVYQTGKVFKKCRVIWTFRDEAITMAICSPGLGINQQSFNLGDKDLFKNIVSWIEKYCQSTRKKRKKKKRK